MEISNSPDISFGNNESLISVKHVDSATFMDNWLKSTFDVSFNDLHEDNKHYKYNNYQIIYGNLKNINDLEEIDVIDIIPDNIVNTIIKNNNINNEETTKDKEVATLKDFIVYKKNFYIIEDKYENILVCRNLNTNIKKYINCYEDYTIMNKNPQRKRS